mmetsp:Transcript_51708/g.138394  ORF Transcript_51708/g.138394 Transcript_51708/m.138394 type:complete len:266 (+) Transcript_51708:374-1171(+)
MEAIAWSAESRNQKYSSPKRRPIEDKTTLSPFSASLAREFTASCRTRPSLSSRRGAIRSMVARSPLQDIFCKTTMPPHLCRQLSLSKQEQAAATAYGSSLRHICWNETRAVHLTSQLGEPSCETSRSTAPGPALLPRKEKSPSAPHILLGFMLARCSRAASRDTTRVSSSPSFRRRLLTLHRSSKTLRDGEMSCWKRRGSLQAASIRSLRLATSWSGSTSTSALVPDMSRTAKVSVPWAASVRTMDAAAGYDVKLSATAYFLSNT